MELMDNIGSHRLAPGAPDESVASWLRQQGATPRMLAIAEACYANDFGCSLEDLGLRESITENQLWEAGAALVGEIYYLTSHIRKVTRNRLEHDAASGAHAHVCPLLQLALCAVHG